MEVDGQKSVKEHKEEDTFCEPCRRGDLNVRAHGLCKECDEYMCQSCYGHHLKAKACSHHSFVENDKQCERRPKLHGELCDRHENEKIKFYCREHCAVGCGDCMVLEHNSCRPIYITELSKDLNNEPIFTEMNRKSNELEEEANSALKQIQEHRNENNKLLNTALEEIKSFRKSVDQYLDKTEAMMINEAKQIHTENETRMEKLENCVKAIHTEMNSLKQDFSEDLYCETALFINSVRSKPKLDEKEQALKTAKSDNFITKVIFKANEDILKMINAEQQIGTLFKDSPAKDIDDSKSQINAEPSKKKWSKSDLKPSMFYTGVRVRRGPDWKGGNVDGNGIGTVTRVFADNSLYVDWDHGKKKHACFGGSYGTYQIEPA